MLKDSGLAEGFYDQADLGGCEGTAARGVPYSLSLKVFTVQSYGFLMGFNRFLPTLTDDNRRQYEATDTGSGGWCIFIVAILPQNL